MKRKFDAEIVCAEAHEDRGLGFQFLLAIQRSILQYAAVTALEVYSVSVYETRRKEMILANYGGDVTRKRSILMDTSLNNIGF